MTHTFYSGGFFTFLVALAHNAQSCRKGCPEAAWRLPKGCSEAAQRLHRGCRKVAKRLPRDCPEVTRRLPRGWTKVARSLPRCCPEATWKLPKGLPNRGKRKLIDFCSFISAWSKVWKKTNSVPLVWQTFCKVVGQNSSWKCKVFLLCNTEASRQIMMSWCLQYDLISASMFHHSIFSRQVLTWFLQGILILWEKPVTQVLYKYVIAGRTVERSENLEGASRNPRPCSIYIPTYSL